MQKCSAAIHMLMCVCAEDLGEYAHRLERAQHKSVCSSLQNEGVHD
jgi:hypothetical protein